MTSNAQAIARSAAAEIGIELSPIGKENIVAMIGSFARIEPGQPVTVTTDDGAEMPVVDYLRTLVAAHPAYVTASPAKATTPDPAGTTMTERMAATIAAQKAADPRAKEIAANAAAFGNPWLPGRTRNLTRQMTIAKNDPDLAERLKSEAGQ